MNLTHQHDHAFQEDLPAESVRFDDIRIGADGLRFPLESTIPAIVGIAGFENAGSPAVVDLHFFQLNVSPLSDAKTIVMSVAVGAKCVRDNEGIRAGSRDVDRDSIKSVAAVGVGAFYDVGGGVVDAGNRRWRVRIVKAG